MKNYDYIFFTLTHTIGGLYNVIETITILRNTIWNIRVQFYREI